MIRRMLADDRGAGLVMALSIAFIVFALAAVWLVLSTHELDQTQYTEHRTSALNSAEAGVRWAMSALAQDTEAAGWLAVDTTLATTNDISTVGVRSALEGADYVTSGIAGGGLGGACDLIPHQLTATGRQTGEWWVRIVPLDVDAFEYQIESWGWSPDSEARQAAAQKIVASVRLVPEFDGFNNAIFAEGQLSGLNRKEIWGDVYAGQTVEITNYTRIYPNDAGYLGDGRFRVYGDLLLGSGSNNVFSGMVDVQGIVRDDKVGSEFADLRIRNQEEVDTTTAYGARSWFREGVVAGEAKFDSKWGGDGYDGTIVGTVVNPVNDLPPVPQVGLPEFSWIDGNYESLATADFPVITHTSAAAFETWFETNEGALSGIHRVPEPVDLDFRSQKKLSGDFMVVVQGSVTVQGSPSVTAAASDLPANLVVVQTTEAGRLTTTNSVVGSDGVLHHLLFSAGEYDAANQTTLYGSVYGKEDVSTNRLEIHFRPPKESLVAGFDFLVPDALWFTPEPIVWRSVGTAEPTPITDYCDVP